MQALLRDPTAQLRSHTLVAVHDSNTIIKFADNTTVIIEDDETAYWEEVCQDSNLFLNISKTKKLIVQLRKRRAEHAPIHIDGAVVERVESFKLLDVHITKDLSWSKHTNTVVKRTQQ